jgi:hypothetical protein
MTTHAIAGVVGLSLLYLMLGLAVLWALRPWESWLELLRHSGLAYLIGVAVFGCTWTLLLVLGRPFDLISLNGSFVVLTAVAIVVGVVREHSIPATGQLGLVGPASLVAAVGVAAAGLYLEMLFRAGRLQGLVAWDAWSFWVPKAKAIYYYGGLDRQQFTTLPNNRYPPLLPIVDAAAFRFMGAADTTTLHLQFWLFGLAFVAAVAGILWHRVPPWILWPFLLLLLVAPRVSEHLLTPQADFLLDFEIAVGVLLVCLWLRERTTWLLAAATILFAAGVVTKREGLLLAVCVYVGAGAATAAMWRTRWPALFLSGAVVGVATVPWRIWNLRHVGAHSATTADPTSSWIGGGSDHDRAWSSLRLSIDVLFGTSRWSVVPILVCCAVLLSLVWGRRPEGIFVGTVCALATLAGAWITLALFPITPVEALNPIVRYTAAVVLAGATVAVPLLGYPAGLLVRGGAVFPGSGSVCAPAAAPGRKVDVVFGRFVEMRDAVELRERARAVGFRGTEAVQDGCGRVVVRLHGVDSVEVGNEIRAEAATVDLHATLELSR